MVGCDREWKIFDISSYGDKPRASGHERVLVRLQLDSGYYLEGANIEPLVHKEENAEVNQDEATHEEDSSTMKVNVRHGEEVHAWEVNPNDSVQQLQLFVQNKWGIDQSQ